jgi:serine/threonine protein kinase
LEEKIAVGFFSDVYKASWRQRTVAVKVLASSTPRKAFLKEMQVWMKLDHPNVLPLFGASSARGDPPWFFVSPCMKYGNIVTFLKRSRKKADSFTHKRLIHEVATGMEYLHCEQITHGDLKV